MTDMIQPALKLENLGVQYSVRGKPRQVLQAISLEIAKGESYGLVGESGCGKSTAAYAVLRYLPRNGSVSHGRILIGGQDLLSFGGRQLRELRRKSVAMVYQDPGRALNPSIRIGRQVEEVFELAGLPRSEWTRKAEEILTRVRISDPQRVMGRYPHQLSGGMQQRVAIAMALASEPALLVLDEPTTGLDATVEADVLDLILQLRREFATSILFISHNLAVIAKMCDRVGVLYAGRLVEQGPTASIFRDPRHPYTVGLLRCLPQRGRSKTVAPLTTIPGFLPAARSHMTGCVFASRCPIAGEKCRTVEPPATDLGGRFTKCHYPERATDLPVGELKMTAPAVRAANAKPILQLLAVSKTYGAGSHAFKALSEITVELQEGETLGLVGESGSGKTTLARGVLGLVRPDPGSTIMFDGKPVAAALAQRSQTEVKSIQIVFQNPDSALNRSHSVRRMIGRTIDRLAALTGRARENRIREITASVQLADRYLGARPGQLSGGLKQRVAIARAFAGDPQVVVCDEPTSSLDVSVQATILNLLVELQNSRQVSYIFISHDLGVVRYISDRIAVLYLGRLMELGPAEEVFMGPHHPYTEALLSSVPAIDGHHPDRLKLTGEIPSAAKPPGGCVFHTRCPRKLGAICEQQAPPATALNSRHMVRCHIAPDMLPREGKNYPEKPLSR